MLIKQLTHCNVYGNGNSFLGQFAEVTFPELKHKMIEHKGGDMIGTKRVPTSLEAMEATFKANGFYEDFNILTANPNAVISLQVRGNQRIMDGTGVQADVPVVLYLRGTFSDRKLGSFKQGDGTQPEYKMEVSYYRLVVNGVDQEEVDIDNSIHVVGGVDLLAQFRDNLGLI